MKFLVLAIVLTLSGCAHVDQCLKPDRSDCEGYY